VDECFGLPRAGIGEIFSTSTSSSDNIHMPDDMSPWAVRPRRMSPYGSKLYAISGKGADRHPNFIYCGRGDGRSNIDIQ